MLHCKKFELCPIDGRKSFYGKALVFIDSQNSIAYLYSYNTLVCFFDCETMKFRRTWGGYSVTTMRHVNAFRERYGFSKLSKREWMTLPLFM